MKLLRKRGQPLLLVPSQTGLATRALELYPAQTTRSRLACLAAKWVLAAGLPLGVTSVPVTIQPDDPFIRWLHQLIPGPHTKLPQFAILAGNPNSPGQRLIILLFNASGQPAVVVKAGLTDAAQSLIKRELEFFEQVPPGVSGIPALRARFDNRRLRALALDYLPGHTPVERDESSLPRVLGGWLQPHQQIQLTDTQVWQELASTCANHSVFQSVAPKLQDRTCRAAIHHGDFAPWNVRVSPQGDWTALDWERGEVNGLPAWDWFHYELQKAILVRRLKAEALADLAERLLASVEFKVYAEAAGVTGLERTLLQLYLLHHTEVIRPSEGLSVTQDLMKVLSAKWR